MNKSTVIANQVAVIGAGITGLLVAQGLRKNGFNVVVFEKDANMDARRRDWTILIHWAMPIFTKLLPESMLDHLSEALCNPHLNFTQEVESLPCYNGLTGKVLFKSPTPGARRVSRQRMRRVLVEGLDIRWGQTFRSLTESEESINLTFTGGETFRADFVVGADGARSLVREILVGYEAAQIKGSGFMFATGITRYGDAAKVEAIVEPHPVAAIMIGTEAVGGVGVLSVDDPNDKSTWTTFWVKIWKGQLVDLHSSEALEYMKANTQGLCEPFKSAIEWSPESTACDIDEMKYWEAVPWNSFQGRVTLLGDAAHPMLIFRGQGLQHGIIDADNYVQALLKIDSSDDTVSNQRAEIMAEFDAEVIERGNKAVRQSLQEAEFSLDINNVSKMLMATKGHGRSA